MLRLSLTALFHHSFIFFAFLPWCKAFLSVNDPTPNQGSNFYSGQGFTLRWSGSMSGSSTMDIEIWDSDDNKLWKKWDSIPISSMSFSDTLPSMPSGKYFFWCGDTGGDGYYGSSDNFFVSPAPVIMTNAVTTTATTPSKPVVLIPPTTTTGFTQPIPPNPPAPPPTSGVASVSNVAAPHIRSTAIPTNSSSIAPAAGPAINGGPTNGTSSPTSTSSSSSITPGSSPVDAIAHSKHTATGAIVGGTLGGVAILFAIFVFVIIRSRRRSSFKESQTYIPTDSVDKILHLTEHGDEQSLPTTIDTAPVEQQRIVSDLERNVAENSRNDNGPSNGDEETQRLMSQIAIMNARIQQLEVHEQPHQSTVDLPPPPMYSPSPQLPVNQGAAVFVMHKSALPSAGADVAEI